jgi:hypothetical protein
MNIVLNKSIYQSRYNGAQSERPEGVSSGWKQISELVYLDPKTGIIFDIIIRGASAAQVAVARLYNKVNKLNSIGGIGN